jgi:predicted nuclease of predicted toxin-antitoxin system
MRILIDENLPEDISCWKSQDFIHAKTLGAKVSDGEIWNFVRQNNLTIVSKDTDFSNRILVSNPPPHVIHLRIGNMRFQALDEFISKNWNEIQRLSEKHKLVNVYLDSIEGIN